ncbi:MAG: DUF4278 domain-containing protein [Cyanobacteria bacterium SID2]|nr:DUF4278 domain-containing protein [Cyanobacteria bacterium SID2]
MKLTYLGIARTTHPQATSTIDTGIAVKFRGLSYTLRRSVGPLEVPDKNLIYRGVSYEIEPSVSSFLGTAIHTPVLG